MLLTLPGKNGTLKPECSPSGADGGVSRDFLTEQGVTEQMNKTWWEKSIPALLLAAALLTGCGGSAGKTVLRRTEQAVESAASAVSESSSVPAESAPEAESAVSEAASEPEEQPEEEPAAEPAKHLGESAVLSGVTLTLDEAIGGGEGVYEAPDNILTLEFSITNNSGKSVWHGHLISIQDEALIEDVEAAYQQKTDFEVLCDGVKLENAQDASYSYSNAEMRANDDWGELNFEEPLPDGMDSWIDVYTPLPKTAWNELVITYKPDWANGESVRFVLTPSDITT